MSAPTHTPVDLTDEQRANLAKLAAAHTRGPWRVDGPRPGTANPNMGLWDVEGQSNVCSGATLADAHLISAALDMLEVLVEFFRSDGFDIESTGNPDATENWLNKARAAIAKATGYSSALAALNAETSEMVALSNQGLA